MLTSCSLHAEVLKRAPRVPSGLAFVRSLDVEGYYHRRDKGHGGAQTLRIRTRYLDPDVNAFVGLVTGIIHFNEDIRIDDPANPSTSKFMWNWGGNIGIKKGRHLWEIDLMGVLLSDRLGPAAALVGEHDLGKGFGIYHRSEGNLFTGDIIADLDQGFFYKRGVIGITVGYRVFTAMHFNRNGPRIGMTFQFNSPKLPFLFPSIG